jgi:hypothetical protein
LRNRLDNALRPPIQRVRRAINVRRRRSPHRAAGIADEEQRACIFQPRLVRFGLKAAAEDQAMRGKSVFKRCEHLRIAPCAAAARMT